MIENLCDSCEAPTDTGTMMGNAYICDSCKKVMQEEISAVRSNKGRVNCWYISRRIYKKLHAGGDYLIRNVPLKLMTALKHRAEIEKKSIRNIILRAIYTYLAK